MSTPVELTIQPDGSYIVKMNHPDLEDIHIPAEAAEGVARCLLAASASYCAAGTLRGMLKARSLNPEGVRVAAAVTTERDEKGRGRITGMGMEIHAAGVEHLDRYVKIINEVCLVTRSLEHGIPVHHEAVSE